MTENIMSIQTGWQGIYLNIKALRYALPTAKQGDFAFLKSTQCIWFWDENKWNRVTKKTKYATYHHLL